jgi:hypothetical protein
MCMDTNNFLRLFEKQNISNIFSHHYMTAGRTEQLEIVNCVHLFTKMGIVTFLLRVARFFSMTAAVI